MKKLKPLEIKKSKPLGIKEPVNPLLELQTGKQVSQKALSAALLNSDLDASEPLRAAQQARDHLSDEPPVTGRVSSTGSSPFHL